jgi:hypothetical protein
MRERIKHKVSEKEMKLMRQYWSNDFVLGIQVDYQPAPRRLDGMVERRDLWKEEMICFNHKADALPEIDKIISSFENDLFGDGYNIISKTNGRYQVSCPPSAGDTAYVDFIDRDHIRFMGKKIQYDLIRTPPEE